MKFGKVLVEQVDANGDLIEGYDCSLSVAEIYERLEKYFPGIEKDKKTGLIIGNFEGKKYTLRCKNITYLGNPHPIFKKRIQIAEDLSAFYTESLKIGATPLLIGIYENQDTILFAEFGIETYIEKKAHNSSAHVYSSDLASAAEDGFFQKTDYFGNHVTVFRTDMVDVFLDVALNEKATVLPPKSTTQSVAPESSKNYDHILHNKILPLIEAFFDNLNKKWFGIDCYNEMFEADYSKKKEAEWTGFYLEYKFEEYIKKHKEINSDIQFYQDRSEGGIDLDLYFPGLGAYGDLKAHNMTAKEIPGNDYETIMKILDKQKHIYYIVAELAATKDKDFNSEVAVHWNKLLNKENLYSYAEKMKHDATVVKAYVLDINNENRQYLSEFRQGINSNRKPRAPKIKIEDKYLEHFIIKEINYEQE